MIIPAKMLVGFQKREHATYRGVSEDYHEGPSYLLGFATFKDKGKIRKETSWEGWRDKKIPVQELDNIPREGFTFAEYDKRSSDWFGSGRTMFRLSDPYGFDLEITPSNLMALICNCDISEGKLIGEFVWAWEGKDLALLSVNSELYAEATETTRKKNAATIKSSELQNGDEIATKNDDSFIYIGKCYQMKMTDKSKVSKISSKIVHAVICNKGTNKGKYNLITTLEPVSRTPGTPVISIEDFIKEHNLAKVEIDKLNRKSYSWSNPTSFNSCESPDGMLSIEKIKVKDVERVEIDSKEILDTLKSHKYIRFVYSSTGNSISRVGNYSWYDNKGATPENGTIMYDEKNDTINIHVEADRYRYGYTREYVTESQILSNKWFRFMIKDKDGVSYIMQ